MTNYKHDVLLAYEIFFFTSFPSIGAVIIPQKIFSEIAGKTFLSIQNWNVSWEHPLPLSSRVRGFAVNIHDKLLPIC